MVGLMPCVQTLADENQIAARVLWAATHPERGQDRSPEARAALAGRLRALERIAQELPVPLIRLYRARVAVLARWGDATLGIAPVKSGNVDTNRMAARILAEAIGEAPRTAPPAKPAPMKRLGPRAYRR